MGQYPETVLIRTTEEMYQYLNEMADAEDTSLSEVIRRIIKENMRYGGVIDPQVQLQRVQRQIAELTDIEEELETALQGAGDEVE